MAVATPNQPVYYYECNAGAFRLFYCLPAGELERLGSKNKISRQALADFPDGVDLGCTENDFSSFEATYGYRPEIHPDALLRAFFAIFSSTHNWKKFRGSGFIPAVDLEQQVWTIEAELQKKISTPKILRAAAAAPSLTQHRKKRRAQETQQKRVIDTLKRLRAKGIDPKRTLAKQTFSPIDTRKGEDAESVFTRLHQKRQKGR
jgi:hypothetical protein